MTDVSGAGTEDQSSPSWLFGCVILLAAMLVAGGMIFFFGLLRDIHPPVEFTAATGDLTGLQYITLTGEDARQQAVQWSVSGSVRQLAFSGVGSAMAVLPLPSTDCQPVANALHTKCAGGSVLLGTPITITWSRTVVLDSFPLWQAAASVEVAPTRAGYVNVFARGSRPPVLCFQPPPLTARVWVTRGNLHVGMTVPGLQTTGCRSGLPVMVGTPGARNSPLLEMGRISSVTVTASGPKALAQGFTGPVVLSPGGTTVLGSPSQVAMHAAGGADLCAAISAGTSGQSPDMCPGAANSDITSAGTSGQSLDVRSGAANSVITSAGELVPSEWARDSDIIVPVFGGVVTLCVAGLTAAGQELMAWARGWRPRFRRAERRLSGLLRGRRDRGNAAPPPTVSKQPGSTP